MFNDRNAFIARLIIGTLIFILMTGCGQAEDPYIAKEPPMEDVCKLGSEITIETTVVEGWDENSEEIMAAIQLAVEKAGIVDGMPQKEAIVRLNNHLCNIMVYGENDLCRTIRGALINRRAVCVGYTLAFQYIAQYCGINAVYVHGYAKDTRHAWNGVYFSDGTYLEVDVTMNDVSGYKEKYLLITPEKMEQLHFS